MNDIAPTPHEKYKDSMRATFQGFSRLVYELPSEYDHVYADQALDLSFEHELGSPRRRHIFASCVMLLDTVKYSPPVFIYKNGCCIPP